MSTAPNANDLYPAGFAYTGHSLRILYCRRCGHDTGIPGAVFCDPCRPERLNDGLMTPVDWAREIELAGSCEAEHNPGVWPYVSCCVLSTIHKGGHVDREGRGWKLPAAG